jgi:hypothetical protein
MHFRILMTDGGLYRTGEKGPTEQGAYPSRQRFALPQEEVEGKIVGGKSVGLGFLA